MITIPSIITRFSSRYQDSVWRKIMFNLKASHKWYINDDIIPKMPKLNEKGSLLIIAMKITGNALRAVNDVATN